MGDNLIPGGSISSSRRHECRGCRAAVLLGQLPDETKTLRWHNFDLPPIERGGLRFYRRHFCVRQKVEHEKKYDGRLVGAR